MIRTAFVGFLNLALFGVLGCTSAPPLNEITVEGLAIRAPFVFEGTVLTPNTTTLHDKILKNGAIVRVDKILKAPAEFDHYKDRNAVIAVDKPVEANDTMVFFATGLAFGRELSVRELGRLTAAQSDLRQLLDETLTDLPYRWLRHRIANASLVISGRVVDIIEPAEPTQVFISEHYPHFRGAKILVTSVEFGNYEEPELVVSFPSNQDIMWRHSPSFSIGQQGIWILHGHPLDPSGTRLFNAHRKEDFLSERDLGLVREQINLLQHTSSNQESSNGQ